MKYMLKPGIVEAVQWHKEGDHPAVLPMIQVPNAGWLPTSFGGSVVHAGDYVVKDAAGRMSSMKKLVFETLYEAAE